MSIQRFKMERELKYQKGRRKHTAIRRYDLKKKKKPENSTILTEKINKKKKGLRKELKNAIAL